MHDSCLERLLPSVLCADVHSLPLSQDTPQLEPFDLLLVRADVIHRTADAKSFRISLRFALGPPQKEYTTLGVLHRYTKHKKVAHAIICSLYARFPRFAPMLMLLNKVKRGMLKLLTLGLHSTPFKAIDLESPPFVLTKI